MAISLSPAFSSLYYWEQNNKRNLEVKIDDNPANWGSIFLSAPYPMSEDDTYGERTVGWIGNNPTIATLVERLNQLPPDKRANLLGPQLEENKQIYLTLLKTGIQQRYSQVTYGPGDKRHGQTVADRALETIDSNPYPRTKQDENHTVIRYSKFDQSA